MSVRTCRGNIGRIFEHDFFVQKVAHHRRLCHAPPRDMIAFQSPYSTVHVDGAGTIVRIQRSALDYPDIPAMERDMDSVNLVLDRLGRDRKGLCLDWRESQLRNDEPFEEALRRAMPRLLRGYKSVAVVVRSAVSSLQVKRHFREANLVGEVFQDDTDAFDYLRGSGGAMSRRPTPIPGFERLSAPNIRGERSITSQMQTIERVPASTGARGDRHSSLPPLPFERPSSPGGRDRMSSVPPQPAERTSQLPGTDDRPSSLPPPPPSKGPRST